ncbi:MAG TPA: lactonase family protein [Thermomicrobiales bacterium]|nr:lactonase family protein [Thermomicrobiales bacterium]
MVLYVGAYTEDPMGHARGIGLTRFDAERGVLEPIASTTEARNPSFLVPSANGAFLYSVNELENGGVTALARDPQNGELRRLNSQPTGGAHPCYLSLDRSGRFLLAVNYTGGNLAVFPIGDDGTLEPASQVLAHTGKSVDPNRQEAPHPHMIAPSPDGRFIYVTDLGTDQMLRYRLDTAIGVLEDSLAIAMTPGMGPRHFAFSPDGKTMVVIGELDSTLVSFGIDQDGSLTPVSSVSTLPDDFAGKSSCAHVLFSQDGRFVYGSNRGHDSIAVAAFDAESRGLEIVGIVPTGGQEPRNFTLDPTGEWLLAANQYSDTITVLQRDAETGRLTATGASIESPSPVMLLFVP